MKKTQNPLSESNVGKHNLSNCFSLTIRTGNGLDLGSKSISELCSYLRDISEHVVLNVEKTGMESHLQGGIYCHPLKPLRQDNLRRDLLKYGIKLWEEGNLRANILPTSKQFENFKKHGICVKSHNNFHTLVKYCMKDLSVCHPDVLDCDPYTLLIYEYNRKMWDVIDEIYKDQMPKNVDRNYWNR